MIALTFSIGATLYVLTMMPFLIAVDWRAISGFSWLMMLTSALLALNVSYWIWYTGLKRLGGSRTSVYSYLTPVVAMAVAAVWLASRSPRTSSPARARFSRACSSRDSSTERRA